MEEMTLEQAQITAKRLARRSRQTQYIIRVTNPRGSYISVVMFPEKNSRVEILETVQPEEA